MSISPGSRSIAQELRRLVLVTALPLTLLIAALAYVAFSDAHHEAELSARRESERVAADLEEFLHETERGLQVLAARLGAGGGREPQCDRGLAELVAIHPQYTDARVVDAAGRVICDAKSPPARARSVAQVDWFRALMAGKRFAAGAPEKDAASGRWVFSAAAPIRGADGNIAAAVYVTIDFAGGHRLALPPALSQHIAAGIIDKAGKMAMRLHEPDGGVSATALDPPRLIKTLAAGRHTVTEPDARGEERIWAVRPIAGTDWLAYAGVGTQAELAHQYRKTALIVALALAALVFAVWLALWESRKLAQPIAAIAHAARARAAGSDEPVPIDGPLEVAEVALELNRMIDERRRAEQALREHDARYRTVVEGNNDGFVVTDLEGKVLEVNEAFLRRCGCARAELLGKSVSAIDAKQDAEQIRARIQAAQQRGSAVFETMARAKDGSTWPVEVNASFHAGPPARMLCFVRDISARKRAEAELQASKARWQFALEGAGEGVWDWNATTNEVYFSPQWKATLGYAAADIAPNLQAWDERIHPDDRRRVYASLDRHLAGETPIYVSEYRLRCKDGSYKWILDRGKVIERDAQGRPARVIGTHSDISERKRVEDDVRLLSRAMEQSPAAIVITDPAGAIQYVNPRFEEITGYARAEAIGQNPRILSSGMNGPEVYQQLWATISSGGVWRGELCNRNKSGALFWEYAEISGVRGDSGEIEHYVAVKEDITQYKAAESKIQRLSNLYAALSQCNQAVVQCTTEQEMFEQVCRAVVNVGGLKLAWIGLMEAASKRIVPATSFGDNTGYVAGIEVSADPDRTTGRGPAGMAFRANAPVWCQDFLNDRTTAAWHERARVAGWKGAAALPLCRNGVPVGVISVYSSEVDAFDEETRALLAEMAANISFALDHFANEAERRRAEVSLRESESRLSAIFQASPVGVTVTRVADGKVLDANDAALRMYGFARAEAIGRTATELGVYADPEQRRQLMAQLKQHGQIAAFELDMRGKSGAITKIELSGRVIELQGVQCLIAMMLDVTERKRLEEVHLQAQKLESLGTLAGGIAHDFNNILMAIRGNVDLAIADTGPDHAAAPSLAEIKKASARASELVRRILAFARPAEARQEAVDLRVVVGEVLKLLRSTLPAGISLQQEFSEDVPPVLADAGQVHEAIVNLSTNAAYAIGAHAGVIEYRLEAVRVGQTLAASVPGIKEGRYVRLSVSDSGCGMDADTLARIFDAFYTTKPVGQGTGLGLSMVHGTMRSHGGAVAVESTPGQGSSFALYFPVQRKLPQTQEPAAPARDLFHVGQRVLFVDDEDALVLLASQVLTRLGHEISGFTDPVQALAAFRARPQDFDVVVTDLSMPHLSGFELAREVLALRPQMPVVMTTGYIGSDDEDKARAAGIREVVLKPTTMDELAAVLDRLIRTTTAAS